MARRNPKVQSPVVRFWSKVITSDNPDDCWQWTGSKFQTGYGRFYTHPGHITAASRFSAQLHFGMFDRRLNVLHHCDNPECVNPRHLYLGTQADNVRDMVNRNRVNRDRKSHCVNGHAFTPENTYVRKDGSHSCKSCLKARKQQYRAEGRIK